MYRFIILFMFFMSCSLPHVFAEIVTVEAEGHYIVGDGLNETIDSAKVQAFDKAKQAAAEQAGIYVESHTEIINTKLSKDKITTIAGNILEILNKDIRLVPINDGKAIEAICVIKARIDTSKINVEDIVQKEEQIKKITEQSKRIQELEEEAKKLKEKYDSLSSGSQKNIVQEEFNENRRQSLITIYEKDLDIYDMSNKIDKKELMETATKLGEIDPFNPVAFRATMLVYRDQEKAEELIQHCKHLLGKDIPADLKIEIYAQLGDLYYNELNDRENGKKYIDKGIELVQAGYPPEKIEELVNGGHLELAEFILKGKTNTVQQLYILKSDMENIIPTFDTKTVIDNFMVVSDLVYNIKYATDFSSSKFANSKNDIHNNKPYPDENGLILVEGWGLAPSNRISNSFAKTFARQAAILDGLRQQAEVIVGVTVRRLNDNRIITEVHFDPGKCLKDNSYRIKNVEYQYYDTNSWACKAAIEINRLQIGNGR